MLLSHAAIEPKLQCYSPGDGSLAKTHQKQLMKKKQMKRLVLAKEMVRHLEEGTLVRAIGASGSGTQECLYSNCLQCQNTQICNTYTTCGSRAC